MENITAQEQRPRSRRGSRKIKTRLKVLMLRVRLLHPLDSGGKIRTAKHLEELSKDHDVTLICYRYPEDTDEDVKNTAALCKNLVVIPRRETPKDSLKFYMELAGNLFNPLPYVVSKYSSREMSNAVAALHNHWMPDLVLCDFLQSCEGIRGLRNVPFVLFQHNVEASIFRQLADRSDSFLQRAFLRLQARRLRAYEKKQCRRAAHIIAVSDIDRRTCAREYGATQCDAVPTGVDTEFFHPAEKNCITNNLVFTGSMDWMANQDAMHFFVNEVLPSIREEIPSVMLSIVGRRPPKEILKLGNKPGVNVTGPVNDIRPFVHNAKVYVAPLRIGSGTRIKLLEAMGMGKAIVSTTLGAEGLPIEHGKNIVLADDARTFAEQTIRLLRDHAWRTELETRARQLAVRDHSWAKVGKVFNSICVKAALRFAGNR